MSKYEDLRGNEDSLLVTTGRAWVFGDDVSCRQVLADQYLDQPPTAASRHAMAELNPQFASHAAAGDCIVAGRGFATDATQQTVPAALKALGIAAVIARSFGEAFVRNALRIGLAALVVEETGAIKNGDHLRVDVEAHIVANLSSGDRYVVRNLDDATVAILRKRGMSEQIGRGTGPSL